MNEHKVWTILNKDIYTEKGIEEIEQIYDFLCEITNTVEESAMHKLFDIWSYYHTEVHWILGEILHNGQ